MPTEETPIAVCRIPNIIGRTAGREVSKQDVVPGEIVLVRYRRNGVIVDELARAEGDRFTLFYGDYDFVLSSEIIAMFKVLITICD